MFFSRLYVNNENPTTNRCPVWPYIQNYYQSYVICLFLFNNSLLIQNRYIYFVILYSFNNHSQFSIHSIILHLFGNSTFTH